MDWRDILAIILTVVFVGFAFTAGIFADRLINDAMADVERVCIP